MEVELAILHMHACMHAYCTHMYTCAHTPLILLINSPVFPLVLQAFHVLSVTMKIIQGVDCAGSEGAAAPGKMPKEQEGKAKGTHLNFCLEGGGETNWLPTLMTPTPQQGEEQLVKEAELPPFLMKGLKYLEQFCFPF